jgi:hypothetical protein
MDRIRRYLSGAESVCGVHSYFNNHGRIGNTGSHLALSKSTVEARFPVQFTAQSTPLRLAF